MAIYFNLGVMLMKLKSYWFVTLGLTQMHVQYD